MEARGAVPEERENHEPVAEQTVAQKSTRKRNITIFVIVSIINAALLVLLWTQLLTPDLRLAQSQQNDGSSFGDVSSPLVGKSAPNFVLKTLGENSRQVQLSDFKGKPVILNFWASWCQPCNEETPFLQKSWQKLQAQGVVMIGVDAPEDTNNALKFLQKYGVTYLNVQDKLGGETAINYGATGFPETVFINRDGVVVAKWVFPLNEEGLQLEMAKLAR